LKFLKRTLLIIFLLITLIYTVNISNIPKRVILFENEELSLGEIPGVTIKKTQSTTIETSTNSRKN
jgi:hypothetical protein